MGSWGEVGGERGGSADEKKKRARGCAVISWKTGGEIGFGKKGEKRGGGKKVFV